MRVQCAGFFLARGQSSLIHCAIRASSRSTATLAGRISMDLITLNLEEIPDARVGDEVILWGKGLPVENLARKAGTIPYELLCGVTQRVAMRLV